MIHVGLGKIYEPPGSVEPVVELRVTDDEGHAIMSYLSPHVTRSIARLLLCAANELDGVDTCRETP